MLHGVYVIVAEEAQADLAEGAGWHHLCHSHLQRGRRRQEGGRTPSPAHRTGTVTARYFLLLRMLTRKAGKTGKLVLSPMDRRLLSNCMGCVYLSQQPRAQVAESPPHCSQGKGVPRLSPAPPRLVLRLPSPLRCCFSAAAESTPPHSTPHPDLGSLWGSLVEGPWLGWISAEAVLAGLAASPPPPSGQTHGQEERL